MTENKQDGRRVFSAIPRRLSTEEMAEKHTRVRLGNDPFTVGGPIIVRVGRAADIVRASSDQMVPAETAEMEVPASEPRTCGGCYWMAVGEEDGFRVLICSVDPPMIWRGESIYRSIRPRVESCTPACSRCRPRQD